MIKPYNAQESILSTNHSWFYQNCCAIYTFSAATQYDHFVYIKYLYLHHTLHRIKGKPW